MPAEPSNTPPSRRHVLIASLAAGLVGRGGIGRGGDARAAVPETVFPGSSWQAVPADAHSAARRRALDEVHAYLDTLATTALMAVQDGRVLFTHGPVARTSILASARKSILSMLYGNYVADGTIDLDRTLESLGIDDDPPLLPIERQATVRDLLTARSGVFHAAANPYGDDHTAAPPRGSQVPGRYFLYDNWGFNAAGTVFAQLTGSSIYRKFTTDLAVPLQLEDYDEARHALSGDASLSRHLSYQFDLSTRDMARLGHLMLNGGAWAGRQVVPADWVRRSTAIVTPSVEMHPAATARRHMGYGYLWWVPEEAPGSPLEGAFMAWGQYGQFILVVPRHRLVVAHKRQVKPSGNGAVRRVAAPEFLKAATMLIAASLA